MPSTPNQPKTATQIAWEHLSPERKAVLIELADLSAERRKNLIEVADQYAAGKLMWRWLAVIGAIALAVITAGGCISTMTGVHFGFKAGGR